MALSKLTKIVINKFGEFHGEINLKSCTLINCVYLREKEMNVLSKILQFMFLNHDDDIGYLQNINLEGTENDWPFVEIHVQATSNQLIKMRKSYKAEAIIYEVDATEVSALEFKSKLSEFNCLFSFTSFLSPRSIEILMDVNEDARMKLVEDICGNSELRVKYNQHKNKMDELEVQMKFLNDHKKELFMEKKVEKLRIENSKKIKTGIKEFERKYETVALLNLYHNEKKISEKIPEKIQLFTNQLDGLKNNYKDHFARVPENVKNKFKLEGEIFKAEVDLESAGKLVVDCKKNMLNYQDELESLMDQKEYAEFSLQRYEHFKTQIDDVTKQMLELDETHKKYKDSIIEYKNLECTFLEENSDYFIYQMARRQIERFEMISNKLENFKYQFDNLQEEQSIYNNQLINLTDKTVLFEDKLNKIKNQIKEYETEFVKTESYVKKAKKFITEKTLREHNDIKHVKNIERILRARFSNSIIGILSELFDVKDFNGLSLKKSQILRCLGDMSNAIIVENPKNYDEARDYLLKQSYYDANDIKLLSQKHCKLPPSISDLRAVTFPNVKLCSIENLLVPTTEKIKKILMHLLGPVVVCDCKSNDEIEKIYRQLGKKVTVISFVAGIIRNDKVNYSWTNEFESLMETTNEVMMNSQKLAELRVNLQVEKHKYLACLRRLNCISLTTNWINEALKRNLKAIEFLIPKIAKLEQLKRQIDNSDDVQELYDKLYVMFQPMLEEYFKDFYEKYNFQSLQGYQEMFSKIINYDMTHKSLAETLHFLTESVDTLKKLILTEDWNMKKNKIKSELKKLSETENTLLEKYEEARLNNEECYVKWKNQIIQLDETMENLTDAKIKLNAGYMKRNSEVNEKHSSLCEIYILLNEVLINFEKIPLHEGSLLSLLLVPSKNDIDANFDLINHHLIEISVDYDGLDENYKTAENYKNISNELQKEISSLRKALSEFPLDLDGEDELPLINEKISKLSIEIKNRNIDCQKALKAFKSIRDLRRNRFNECVNDINKAINEYCTVVSNEHCHGELLPSNENDPYLGNLQYIWSSNGIQETSKNINAALAFLLGILKYKRQNLVPYFETSNKSIWNAIAKYSSNNDTKLQTIIFMKTECCEDKCHYTIMRFNDKIKIIDNDEEQEFLI